MSVQVGQEQGDGEGYAVDDDIDDDLLSPLRSFGNTRRDEQDDVLMGTVPFSAPYSAPFSALRQGQSDRAPFSISTPHGASHGGSGSANLTGLGSPGGGRGT
eukprot:CAMPEP_0173360522 /NCGR_PEP_ID=MMETSP1144-20121109/20650_1 /TAXON_ID=483371 /ORGANISM="non described non described, Strain CCMP2298" /LENGTH=101 /DNA_ID=CAMNT_0014309917 /DNA_START=31 /DNA_END=332 /DNA_ORIENTATION=+